MHTLQKLVLNSKQKNAKNNKEYISAIHTGEFVAPKA